MRWRDVWIEIRDQKPIPEVLTFEAIDYLELVWDIQQQRHRVRPDEVPPGPDVATELVPYELGIYESNGKQRPLLIRAKPLTEHKSTVRELQHHPGRAKVGF